MPSQSVRTAERERHQQYSTPFSYAYAINWIANLRADDVILEPSAGNGNLAIYGQSVGAQVHVNELDAHRLEMLRLLGFEHRTTHNAEQIDNLLDPAVEPTVVVMNPPFSMTAEGIADVNVGAQHVLQALRRLAPGGRLVAIVGGGINMEGRPLGGMATDARQYREFFERAGRLAQLRANVHVDGRVYQRFGTAYDTRVLVFDKPEGGFTETVTPQEASVETVEALIETLAEVRNERTKPRDTGDRTVQPESPPEPGGTQAPEGDGERELRAPQPGTDTGVSGTPSAAPGRDVPPGVGAGGTVDTGVDRRADESDERTVDDAEGGDAGTDDIGRGAERGARGDRTDERPGGGGGTPDGGDTSESTRVSERETRADVVTEAAREEQQFVRHGVTAETLPVGAKPHGIPLDETVAMAEVDLPEATYTPNLPAELIQTGALSSAQLEFVIYAGQAHLTDIAGNPMAPGSVRGGMFSGDSTGLGKGREIVGVILDSFHQGRKKALHSLECLTSGYSTAIF